VTVRETDSPISFRPNAEDRRIINSLRAANAAETPTELLRKGLRLLEREQWRQQAYRDFERLRDEDLSTQPDDWSLDSAGNIIVHLSSAK